MSPKKKKRKLFKVASEFNVSTPSIVETLADEGYEIATKPNSKISPEMYDVLESIYGDDKAKSEEHTQTREEYENRRNQIRSGGNDSV